MSRLTRNAVQCPSCGDVIESKHVHDFRECSCGDVFVDGGLEYSRVGWRGEMPIPLQEYAEEDEK